MPSIMHFGNFVPNLISKIIITWFITDLQYHETIGLDCSRWKEKGFIFNYHLKVGVHEIKY